MKLEDRCYSCEYGSWHTENDVLQYGCDYGSDAADCNYRKKQQTTLNHVGSISNYETSHYFNCKRCGAVGQYGVCEYCGSAEE